MYMLRHASKKINLPRGYMIDDITVNVGYRLQQCVSCLGVACNNHKMYFTFIIIVSIMCCFTYTAFVISISQCSTKQFSSK